MCRNWAIAFVTGFAKGLIIMIFGAIFECEACEGVDSVSSHL